MCGNCLRLTFQSHGLMWFCAGGAFPISRCPQPSLPSPRQDRSRWVIAIQNGINARDARIEEMKKQQFGSSQSERQGTVGRLCVVCWRVGCGCGCGWWTEVQGELQIFYVILFWQLNGDVCTISMGTAANHMLPCAMLAV